ncbi:hypothetical protein [Indioceanicola profundi]|uniref:hypothetical protein n=1 Tax=Indioceanicola profundi TaxID=2220096 RepID=UPI000E6ABBEC|nr:hypothetical protein [Indioceanicola profundi]
MDGLTQARIIEEERLSVAELVRHARMGWHLLVIGALIGTAAALLAVRLAQPQFTAQMVVGPIARIGPAAMGPKLPTLSGGAGRSITEPGPGDEALSDFARFLRLLGSVPVAQRLAGNGSLMPGIFHRSWDAGTGSWKPPGGLVPAARRLLLWLAGRTGWVPPDAQALSEHLRTNLVVEALGGGPMQRISYRHQDRALAMAVVAGVHAAADRALRAEAARRVLAEIEYVRARLTEVTHTEHRRALVALLAEQERLRMMIDVDLPFAADAIETVTAPVLPDWPDPLVLVPFGGLAGFMATLFWVYGRAALLSGRR